MSKQITTTAAPKLRFPEFQDAPPWTDSSIERVCTSFSGGTPLTAQKEYYGGSIPFIRSAEIDKETTELFLTKEGLRNSASKLVNKGDILYALYGANSGDVSLARQNGAINQAVLCLRSDCNPFIYQYLSFKKSFIVAKYIQGGQGNLSGEIVKSIAIYIPKPNEQQKIADCLTSIDGLIVAQNEKLDSLKAHKKGLMQQLFPVEGESTPKVRFTEYRNAGEWEESPLGRKEISIFLTEKIPVEQLNLKTFVSTDNLLPDYGGIKIASKLPPAGSVNRFEKGDILISNIRPYLKKIWSATMDGAASNDVIVIRTGSFLIESFLSALLKNDDFVNYIMKGAQGLKMPRGDKSLIGKYPIVFPTKNEQQKIADCLSSVDELITAQTQKIQTLKEHKKGLMQQLFPSI